MSAPRWACVDLPALPLQLMLQRNPKWRGLPAAVVADDRPQGELLWVNEHARKAKILPGMRYAAARTLDPRLRAAVITPQEIDGVLGDLFATLHRFTPRVEPNLDQPGVFFLDPGGLARLYGSTEQWCATVHQELQTRGFRAAVIVGFSRYRCYAVARTHTGCWVIASPEREARMAAAAPLDRLDLAPAVRDELAALDVRTLGQLVALPAADVRLRFGEAAARIHALASDARWAPLQARALVDPIAGEVQLEPPESDHERLLARLRPPLERLLDQLAGRGQALCALHLRLHLDHAGTHDERLEPASPTLDATQLLELLGLRLEGLRLRAAIEQVDLQLEGLRVDAEQVQLFRARQRRDLAAGGRALARLRAAFGPDAVTRARLQPAHLPEASFVWTPVLDLRFPRGSPVDALEAAPATPTETELPPVPLVRRLLPRPRPLPDRPRHEPERWPGVDPQQGPMVRMSGPFRISGGWWVRTVERDYYYVETRRGDVLWVFYDRPRRRWFLHGEVD